ncbi:MAG: class SAM-dependent methyltransferase [Thermoleophilia bacterium]|nr:class SAM-dependent methyltransferase [Thermoleophilia bacterium]
MHEHDWDQQYRDGDHEGDGAPPSPELVVIVATFGDDRGRVVDLGCGVGADAIFLAGCGFDVTGVDMSGEALDIAERHAEERGLAVNWHQGDVLELPLDDGSIVAAFDRGCLHHVPVADQPRYAAELARVLAPGGRAYLRDVAGHGHGHAHGHGHHPTPVSAEGLERLLDGLPLEVVSITSIDMAGPTAAGTPGILAELRRSAT